MRIAFLVLAHDNPRHFVRLVDALSAGWSTCFVHINRKSRLNDFSHIKGENVCFCDQRIPVYWGDFSLIEATLALMRQALNDRRGFDYAVLLSGVDYPLYSTSYIEHFFERQQGTQFMSIVKMPSAVCDRPMSRLTRFQRRPGESSLHKITASIMTNLGWRRDVKYWLGNLQPFGGDFWSGLTREACQYIQRFVERETQIVEFFKNAIIPTESFFHTILGNSPFKEKLSRTLTYADWSAGGSHPAYISDRHVDQFESNSQFIMDDAWGKGEVLFARKFSDDSNAVVDRLDQLRKRKE